MSNKKNTQSVSTATDKDDAPKCGVCHIAMKENRGKRIYECSKCGNTMKKVSKVRMSW